MDSITVKIIATIGISGSGKTTWASQFKTKQPHVYISSDCIRNEIYGDSRIQGSGEEVFNIFYKKIETVIREDKIPICDATFYSDANRERLIAFAAANEIPVEWHYFIASLETAFKNNKLRDRFVPEKIIKKQFNLLSLPYGFGEIITHYNGVINELSLKKNSIICDLDGTLAIVGERSPYDASKCNLDTINSPVLSVINKFKDDHSIIFLTGRSDIYREHSVNFINTYVDIVDPILLMRADTDNRKDTVVKFELFSKFINNKTNVLFVLEDRTQVVNMWRQIGLNCFQVNSGDF